MPASPFPPQNTCPAGQAAHTPPVHTCAEPHDVPAFAPAQSPVAPQWLGSVVGSTHVPSQATCPGGQLVVVAVPVTVLVRVFVIVVVTVEVPMLVSVLVAVTV